MPARKKGAIRFVLRFLLPREEDIRFDIWARGASEKYQKQIKVDRLDGGSLGASYLLYFIFFLFFFCWCTLAAKDYWFLSSTLVVITFSQRATFTPTTHEGARGFSRKAFFEYNISPNFVSRSRPFFGRFSLFVQVSCMYEQIMCNGYARKSLIVNWSSCKRVCLNCLLCALYFWNSQSTSIFLQRLSNFFSKAFLARNMESSTITFTIRWEISKGLITGNNSIKLKKRKLFQT